MAQTDLEAPELRRSDIMVVDDGAFDADRVALITGAGSGIGRATALTFAHNGLTVVGADVDAGGLAETEATKADLGLDGTLHTVTGDLADESHLEALVEAAADKGDLTYLLNVAGLQHVSPLESFPMDRYDYMHRVMLRAPFGLAKLSLPHLRTGDATGVVGNMASIHGHVVTQDKAAYNVFKFGLRGLTQSISAEGDGEVRSFSISPTAVKTELLVDQIADNARERGITPQEFVETVLLGDLRTKQLMDPVDIANVFLFGCSTHSELLNGGDFRWDGGLSYTY